MEKRKLRILTVVVFAGVLIFGALRQNSTGRGELGEISKPKKEFKVSDSIEDFNILDFV